MNVKDLEEQKDTEISERRMRQLATFIIYTFHCGKHIRRRTCGLHLTHVTHVADNCPKCVHQQTQI